jgi:hypothetical protein
MGDGGMTDSRHVHLSVRLTWGVQTVLFSQGFQGEGEA